MATGALRPRVGRKGVVPPINSNLFCERYRAGWASISDLIVGTSWLRAHDVFFDRQENRHSIKNDKSY